jgi:hypothetical protein
MHARVLSDASECVCAWEHACWLWHPGRCLALAEQGRGMAYGALGRQGLIGQARWWQVGFGGAVPAIGFALKLQGNGCALWLCRRGRK